jgi:hypothetical protein
MYYVVPNERKGKKKQNRKRHSAIEYTRFQYVKNKEKKKFTIRCCYNNINFSSYFLYIPMYIFFLFSKAIKASRCLRCLERLTKSTRDTNQTGSPISNKKETKRNLCVCCHTIFISFGALGSAELELRERESERGEGDGEEETRARETGLNVERMRVLWEQTREI